jgi:cytochrome c oxidase subunit 2
VSVLPDAKEPTLKRPFFSRLLAACTAVVTLGAATSLLWAQETLPRQTWWLPVNVFPATEGVDHVFYFILYLTGAVNIAVFVVLALFLVKYRHKEGRQAAFIHGNNRLEAVWTLIPTLILALTAVFSQTTWSQIKSPARMPAGDDVVQVRVIARQFAWYFHYPGKDGKFGPRKTSLVDASASEPEKLIGLDRTDPAGKDDILTVKMVVPVDRKVHVTGLTSVDVIHSFYLPNFRIKQDAVPGLNGEVWLLANTTSAQVMGSNADGSPKPFDIVCAELCGQGHFKMRGQLFVVTQEEYEKFLQTEASFLDAAEDAGY